MHKMQANFLLTAGSSGVPSMTCSFKEAVILKYQLTPLVNYITLKILLL